jgi:hypothetical protein
MLLDSTDPMLRLSDASSDVAVDVVLGAPSPEPAE